MTGVLWCPEFTHSNTNTAVEAAVVDGRDLTRQVVVVGQGSHAVYAALWACQSGAPVTLVCQGSPWRGGVLVDALLVPAGGGVTTVPAGFDGVSADLWRTHLPALVARLDAMGLPWDRGVDGTPLLAGVTAGIAAVTAGPHTGHVLHQTLLAQLRRAVQRGAVTVLERHALASLVLDDAGACCGITVVDVLRRTVTAVSASAVLLAAEGTHAMLGPAVAGPSDATAVLWAAAQAGLHVDGTGKALLQRRDDRTAPVVRGLSMGLTGNLVNVRVGGCLLAPPPALLDTPGALESWQWAHTLGALDALTSPPATDGDTAALAKAAQEQQLRLDAVASRRGPGVVAAAEDVVAAWARAVCGLEEATPAQLHDGLESLRAAVAAVDAQGGAGHALNPWPVRALLLDAVPALLSAWLPPRPILQPPAPLETAGGPA